MPNAWRIAESLGIRMHGRRDPHPGGNELPARHTWARKTINDVALAGEQEGLPEHVYDVLGLIMVSNQTQLFGDVIQGVSRWAIRNRITTEEVQYLRPAFEQVDLKLIRGAVKRHAIRPQSPQIAFLVASQMEAAIWALRQ